MAAGAGASTSRRGAIASRAVEWSEAPGGEGSNQAIDPQNPNIVYSHGFYGNFTREDLGVSRAPVRGAQQPGRGRGRRPGVTAIRPPQEPGGPELRAQWMAPILVSPHDPATIYAGYQFVLRSINRGDAWQAISKDLSANDPAQMLLKSSNAIPYQTIVSLAESPRAKGLIYAGTDDGHLHVTRDGGATWTELTSALPTRKWISRVVPSQHDEGTVYVTQRGREDDDFGVYVYRSTDFGKTFTSIASNIPSGSVNVIREDPTTASRLFVGTDFGAFVSNDGGKQWSVLGGNLPSVQVSDLQYQPRDRVIVISTYGRGMWAMDAVGIK